MNEKDLFTFVFKIILLPAFISYLLAVDYLFLCRMFREATTLMFIVYSLNLMFQWKYVIEFWRENK